MRVQVGGVGFDNVTMREAVAKIVVMARRTDRPRYVCTGNLDHLVTLQRDREFALIYGDADLVLADGMPIVWLSRWCSGGPLKERVAGSDLFWELAHASHEEGIRLFFLGGSPGSAAGAAEALRNRYPDACVSGMYCPSFAEFGSEAEEARIHDAIREARPDVLLVAFGAPKQEKWIVSTLDRHRVPVSIGVGGSFEMACGVVQRAPQWMQRCGLEWTHRLLQEPSRMWRRYLQRDIPFFLALSARTFRQRHLAKR